MDDDTYDKQVKFTENQPDQSYATLTDNARYSYYINDDQVHFSKYVKSDKSESEKTFIPPFSLKGKSKDQEDEEQEEELRQDIASNDNNQEEEEVDKILQNLEPLTQQVNEQQDLNDIEDDPYLYYVEEDHNKSLFIEDQTFEQKITSSIHNIAAAEDNKEIDNKQEQTFEKINKTTQEELLIEDSPDKQLLDSIVKQNPEKILQNSIEDYKVLVEEQQVSLFDGNEATQENLPQKNAVLNSNSDHQEIQNQNQEQEQYSSMKNINQDAQIQDQLESNVKDKDLYSNLAIAKQYVEELITKAKQIIQIAVVAASQQQQNKLQIIKVKSKKKSYTGTQVVELEKQQVQNKQDAPQSEVQQLETIQQIQQVQEQQVVQVSQEEQKENSQEIYRQEESQEKGYNFVQEHKMFDENPSSSIRIGEHSFLQDDDQSPNKVESEIYMRDIIEQNMAIRNIDLSDTKQLSQIDQFDQYVTVQDIKQLTQMSSVEINGLPLHTFVQHEDNSLINSQPEIEFLDNAPQIDFNPQQSQQNYTDRTSNQLLIASQNQINDLQDQQEANENLQQEEEVGAVFNTLSARSLEIPEHNQQEQQQLLENQLLQEQQQQQDQQQNEQKTFQEQSQEKFQSQKALFDKTYLKKDTLNFPSTDQEDVQPIKAQTKVPVVPELNTLKAVQKQEEIQSKEIITTFRQSSVHIEQNVSSSSIQNLVGKQDSMKSGRKQKEQINIQQIIEKYNNLEYIETQVREHQKMTAMKEKSKEVDMIDKLIQEKTTIVKDSMTIQNETPQNQSQNPSFSNQFQKQIMIRNLQQQQENAIIEQRQKNNSQNQNAQQQNYYQNYPQLDNSNQNTKRGSSSITPMKNFYEHHKHQNKYQGPQLNIKKQDSIITVRDSFNLKEFLNKQKYKNQSQTNKNGQSKLKQDIREFHQRNHSIIKNRPVLNNRYQQQQQQQAQTNLNYPIDPRVYKALYNRAKNKKIADYFQNPMGVIQQTLGQIYQNSPTQSLQGRQVATLNIASSKIQSLSPSANRVVSEYQSNASSQIKIPLQSNRLNKQLQGEQRYKSVNQRVLSQETSEQNSALLFPSDLVDLNQTYNIIQDIKQEYGRQASDADQYDEKKRWNKVVGFMSKNPKVLMQILQMNEENTASRQQDDNGPQSFFQNRKAAQKNNPNIMYLNGKYSPPKTINTIGNGNSNFSNPRNSSQKKAKKNLYQNYSRMQQDYYKQQELQTQNQYLNSTNEYNQFLPPVNNDNISYAGNTQATNSNRDFNNNSMLYESNLPQHLKRNMNNQQNVTQVHRKTKSSVVEERQKTCMTQNEQRKQKLNVFQDSAPDSNLNTNQQSQKYVYSQQQFPNTTNLQMPQPNINNFISGGDDYNSNNNNIFSDQIQASDKFSSFSNQHQQFIFDEQIQLQNERAQIEQEKMQLEQARKSLEHQKHQIQVEFMLESERIRIQKERLAIESEKQMLYHEKQKLDSLRQEINEHRKSSQGSLVMDDNHIKSAPEDGITNINSSPGLNSTQVIQLNQDSVMPTMSENKLDLTSPKAFNTSQYDEPQFSDNKNILAIDNHNLGREALNNIEKEEQYQLRLKDNQLNQNNLNEVKSTGSTQKITDWFKSPLMKDVEQNKTSFNIQNDSRFYRDQDMEYIIDSFKNRYKDFKKANLIEPLHTKALATLTEIMTSLNQYKQLNKILESFKEANVQNTYKCLVRCRLMIEARNLMYEVLKDIQKHEQLVQDIKKVVDQHLEQSIDEDSVREIQALAMILPNITINLRNNIIKLRDEYKMFQRNGLTNKRAKILISNVFVYKKRDALKFILQEYEDIRNLVMVFDIKEMPFITEKLQDLSIMRRSGDSKMSQQTKNSNSPNRTQIVRNSYQSTASKQQQQHNYDKVE